MRMPYVIVALVLAGLTYWGVKKYKPSLLGGTPASPPAPLPPGPSPAPAPPQPAPVPGPPPVSINVTVTPGVMPPLSIPAESSFTLNLPLGAAWAPPAPGVSAIAQAANSVLNATLNPAVPTADKPQTWSNVGGSGTLQIGWMDAAGNNQSSTLAVSTTGSAHTLGNWLSGDEIGDHMAGRIGRPLMPWRP